MKRKKDNSKDTVATKDYNKTYYRENSASLIEKKKERYRKDREYHEAIRARAKKQRDDKRLMLAGRVLRVVNGQQYMVHKIGSVAKSLNISTTRIVNWEMTGLVPDPSFDGVRVYLDHQVQLIALVKEAVESTATLVDAATKLGDTVKSQW